MAIKQQITLDEISLLELDADPTVSGVDAPVGSFSFLNGGQGSWQKISVSNTGWQKMANESLLRYAFEVPYYTALTTVNSGNFALTNSSNSLVIISGSATGYSINLPDATTLQIPSKYEIYNTSSYPVTIKGYTGATLFVLSQSSIARITLITNTTSAGVWINWQVYSNYSGIVTYNAESTTTFTTTSTSAVLITGMSVTPVAGTYIALGNASFSVNSTYATCYASIYVGGSLNTGSERGNRTGISNALGVLSTMSQITVNGSQAVELRGRTSAATLTTTNRNLTLIRTGN